MKYAGNLLFVNQYYATSSKAAELLRLTLKESEATYQAIPALQELHG